MQLLLPSLATPQTSGSTATSELGSSDDQVQSVEFFGVWSATVNTDDALSLPGSQGQELWRLQDEEPPESLGAEQLLTKVLDLADEEEPVVTDGEPAPAISFPPLAGKRGAQSDGKAQLAIATNDSVVLGFAPQDQNEEAERAAKAANGAPILPMGPGTTAGGLQLVLPQTSAVENARLNLGNERQGGSVAKLTEAGATPDAEVAETERLEAKPSLTLDNSVTAPLFRETAASTAAVGGSSVAVTTVQPLEPLKPSPEVDRQTKQVASQTPQLVSSPVLSEQLSQPNRESEGRRSRYDKIDRLIAPSQPEITAQSSPTQVNYRSAQSSQQVMPSFPDGVPIVREILGNAAHGTWGGTVGELEVSQKVTTVDRPRTEPTVARSVVIQIVHSATRSASEGVIEVRLQPEELGRVRLAMVSGEAGFTVQVTAERPDTLDLIRRNIDLLENDLRDRGFADMSFSFSGEHQSDTPSFGDDDAPVRNVRDNHEETRLVADVTAPDANIYNVTLDIRV